ncbi:hypothetical protein [Mycobacterium phage WXIN]|nr:hypothetical protein [Mycobacterium phage WXIN]
MSTQYKAEHESAVRFFRIWLIGAVAVSIIGNVADSLLNREGANPFIAGPAAVVSPALLLGATWGVHKLVQTGLTGTAYKITLRNTVILAAIGFVMSFSSLRDLMLNQGGMSALNATLWPIGVDLSIAGSITALLTLTGEQNAQLETEQPSIPIAPVERVRSEPSAPMALVEAIPSEDPPSDAYLAAASSIVRSGVVKRVTPERVAKVLRAHHGNEKPAAIARDLDMGFDTVKKIVGHPDARHELIAQ